MEIIIPTSTDLPPMALDKWIAEVGINPSTAWLWRKKGWLKTVNIAGRHYLTSNQRMEFVRRAEAGEFAQAPGGALAKHGSRTVIHGRN